MSSMEQSKGKGRKKQSSRKKPIQKSRKEIRKEQRKQKKVAKAVYFQKRNELRGKHAQNTPHSDKVQEVKKNDLRDYTTNNKILQDQKEHAKEKRQRELQRKREKHRKVLLKEANEQEDKIIKKLEKQLKLNKRKQKSVPKSFVADGLDYLLDFCIEDNRKCIVETEKQILDEESHAEFQTDLTMVIGEDEDNEHVQQNHSETDEIENDDLDEDKGGGNYANDNLDVCEDEEIIDSEVETNAELSDNSKSSSELQMMDNTIQNESNEEDEGLWEDIYGRKRDKKGNIIRSNAYVPPAVRNITRESITHDHHLSVLRKQLKGCLNRVAEHNIHSIANQIDELYMKNSRNSMNDLLTKLMIEALIAPVLTPDRMICEHMMLIAILHANVGVEVGAYVLETLVKLFDKMMQESQDIENKQLDNLILMISHLYNFKIYGHQLLYQILEKLLVKFTEKEIELILLILKSVGFPLRKDDPIALKEFIQQLQQRASQQKGENSRVKFMLDILLAIKNNNVSKLPQYDAPHVEHLKKVVKSVIRKGNAITRFNVSLNDLLYADERGKWWIVGSAWSGSIDVNNDAKRKEGNKLMFGEKLLELARKQRMNTDTRRNIFCILMTAEDYLDAFEKLHHLGLKDQQEREVIHVLMHCCLQEKSFNPYYAVLAQKLCEYNRKYQLTIQYTLWDKLKTLESYSPKQLSNLARFLTHLFVEKSLAFSVLKVIQFAELDKQTMKLLRQITLGILLHEPEEACLQVFERISVSPQLQTFREGLRLFINHFLLKNINSSISETEHVNTLKRRAESVDKILISRGSRVMF